MRAIWWILTKLTSALNFLVLATELKLLIFKISARTFLKNLSFRKELKLFATIYKYMYYNNLRTKRNLEPWFFDSFSSRKKNGKMKILAQFGIFIRIIILNIGGNKANSQLLFIGSLLPVYFLSFQLVPLSVNGLKLLVQHLPKYHLKALILFL